MNMVDFLKQVFGYLNEHTCYAVLRNFEGLPEHNDSRDIDIAIERKEYVGHRKALVEIVEQAGWKIVT